MPRSSRIWFGSTITRTIVPGAKPAASNHFPRSRIIGTETEDRPHCWMVQPIFTALVRRPAMDVKHTLEFEELG